jgi:ankyrin repeat protein
MMAVQRGSADQVRFLISSGMPLDACDSQGRTALHWAVDQYRAVDLDAAMVKATLLLDSGASTTIADLNGETPIFTATRSCESRLVSLLLDWGADANAVNGSGETPLFSAVRDDAQEIITLLLDAGASIEHRDSRGLSPRDVALRSRRLELLNKLRDTHWSGK